MSRLFAIVWIIAAALPLQGFAASDKSVRTEAAKADAAKEAPSGDYVLQPQDMIRVLVYKEPDLSRELRISQEGKIELPLIRAVDLNNKTVRQAEEIIRQLYDADYLVNPQVNISVLEYAPRSIEVFGQVANPGVIYFPKEEGLTLTSAISRAGSFTRLANKKQVTLKRPLPDGTFKIYTINVEDLTKGDATESWPVQPGDVINVPERIL